MNIYQISDRIQVIAARIIAVLLYISISHDVFNDHIAQMYQMSLSGTESKQYFIAEYSAEAEKTYTVISDVTRVSHCNVQSNLDILKLMGLFFTSSNYPKCKLICTFGNLDL